MSLASKESSKTTVLPPKSDAGGPKPGDSQWKDNNPKAGFGAAKVGIDYMSLPVLFEQSIGMMAGGYKYGAHNYLEVAPSVMTYIAAMFRHVGAFVGGEEFDPHAGEGVKVHHLVAAMNCLHVIRAAMIQGNFFDDRPPSMPEGFIESLSESVVAIQRNNPDPVARYLADGKRGPGRILEAAPIKSAAAGGLCRCGAGGRDDCVCGLREEALERVKAAGIFEPPKSQDQVSREREVLDALCRPCCNTDPRLEAHSPGCIYRPTCQAPRGHDCKYPACRC